MAKQTSPFSENQTQSTNKSRMKGLKRIVIFAMTLVLFFGITSNAEAVNYYSFTNGSPSTLALWWTATDGTGTHPANFTTVGDVFTIQSGNTMTTTANWTVAGTLVVNSGGVFAATSTGTTISLGALTINAGGIVNQNRPLTVTGATNITGTINFASTSGTARLITLTGDVILNSGAVWTEPATGNGASNTYNIGGNFTNNATTFNSLGTGVHTFSGAAKTISGTTTTSIGSLAVTGTPTNTGTLTVRTALTGAGNLTNGNGTSGTLNIGGTATITTLTATPANNTVYYIGVAQTAKVTTYNNLTLTGSLVKTFATTPTVNGVLSMEGTATVVVTTGVVTYGVAASLQYNTATARTATLEEWVSPFTGTGGIIIKNTGAITTPGAVQIGNNTSVPLNINSGATLTPGANLLTFHGDFINAGTLTSGAGGVTIAGTYATQSIAGFTTTGTVTLTKTLGTATLVGNVNAGPLTINGTGGTLNLGSGLTHTFSGIVTLTAGTLNGGSSNLNETAISTTAWNGTGSLFSAGTGTVNFGAAGAQTLSASATTFNNLTVSNSGLKTFTNTHTVNGILSMEGTATVSASPTFGSGATLQYNTATSRTVGAEWITPFVATGGVVISNTGTISMDAAKVFNAAAPLTINSASTLSMSTFLLTLNGNLINNGGTASGTTGGVTITGTAAQSIGAFTTTGTVSMTKTGGTATLTGNINGSALTINGSGGTLNLGIALNHTFTGITTLTAGSLNGGSSVLNENAISATAWNGTGSIFTPSSGTVNFGASGNQTIVANSTFHNLDFSGSGNKTLSNTTTIGANFAISGTAVADLGNITSHAAISLTLGGINQVGGTWGSTASSAGNKNNTYFLSTSSGRINVSCTAPSPPTSDGDMAICSGVTIPALTVSVASGTADWYSQESGGTSLATGTLSYTPSGAGTFYAETNLAGCLSVSRTGVTLTINPLPTLLSLTGSTICSSPGGTGTITSTSSQLGVNYQLYNSSNAIVGSSQSGTGAGLSWASLAAGTGYYVKGTSTTSPTNCNSTSSTVNISTYSNPIALTLTGSIICVSPGGNGSITSSTSVSGVSYQLYDNTNAMVQAPQAGTGSELAWTNLPASIGYYVISSDAHSCFSANSYAVDVATMPNPIALVLTGSTICASPDGNGTITSSTSQSGVNYQLFDITDLEVGSPIPGTGSQLTWDLLTAANGYYAIGTNASTLCVSPNSNAVNVSTNPNPSITSSATAVSTCYSSSIQGSTLSYSATTNTPTYYTIVWNTVAHTAGLADVASTLLPASPIGFSVAANVAAGTYTGTLTVTNANGCASVGNTFTVTINNAPSAPTGSASQIFCSGGTVANLVASGTGVLWYAASVGGTALSTPTALVNGTHYYASQTVSGCESSSRLDVTAIVVAAGSWIGATSTDWATGSNWCGGSIPTATTDVTIAAGLTRYPIIGASGAVCRNITIASGATLTIGAYTLTVSGSWTNSGTFTQGASTIAFNGSGNIGASNFNNITLSPTSTQTATGVLSITGNVSITTGTFVAGSFTHTVGGNWTKSGGAFTSTGSTIDFNGSGVGSIGASNFNNITFSGAGTKTATGILSIAGNVNITGNFTAGAYTHTVGGNWTKSGSFTATGSTIDFDGSGAGNIGASNFNNITFSGIGVKNASGALNIVGALTISNNFSAGSYTHTLQGNWSNSGTFAAGTSTFSFNGSSPQTIGGSTSTTFNNLSMLGSGGASLGTTTSVSGVLTLTTGKIDIGAYNLTITSTGSISGGSASSYIKTSSTGRLKQTVPGSGSVTKNYPVGNTAYNPMALRYDDAGVDNYSIKVEDGAISNANSSKTVNRKWYLIKEAAGGANLTLAATYNSGEEGSGFSNTTSPQIGFFDGTSWAYRSISTGSGNTTFTASGSAPNFSNTLGFFVLGSEDAFNATKLAVSNVNPVNPTINLASTVVTVQAQNSNSVPTMVAAATAFDLSATNTAMSGTPTGTISQYAYQTTVSSVQFTQSTWDNGAPAHYNTNATVTATRTSGDLLTAGTSAVFDVLLGTIWEPKATESWDATNGWKKSTDGGSTWTDPATLPGSNAFGTDEVIRIPSGITLTANVSASFYTMLVYGTLDINSSGALTLNHASNDIDYNIYVTGTLKNSGGTLTNSNTAYPITISGGTYWHAMNGGSIPVSNWQGTSTCNVTGITSTALTSGLDQAFQNFTWNNASQAVLQNLSANMTVNGTLTLTSGTITTGSNYVIVGLSGSVTQSGSSYIDGTLRRYGPDGLASVFFPIGSNGKYAPITLGFTGAISGNGYVDASTVVAQPPTESGLSQTNYINRKWTISNSGVTGFTAYTPNLTFDNADKVGSPSLLTMRKLTSTTWYSTSSNTSGNNVSATITPTVFLNPTSNLYLGDDACSSTNAIWFGSTSTDWNTTTNWCSGSVPTSTTDVTIPSSPANQPVIGSAGGSCKSITIQSGASLSISGVYTLDVHANWLNSGTFTANAGTVSFTGSVAQTITGATTFNNLTIDNALGVTAANDITVNGELALTSANPTADAVHGTLDMATYTLNMQSASASVTGIGDVTGIVKRTHIFTPNIPYQFGSQFTTLNFMGIGTEPSEISCRIEIGAASTWKAAAVKRYYSFAQTGATGTDKAVINLRYLTSELQANDETKLVLWDYHSNNSEVDEHGKTNNSISDHWVRLSGLSIGYISPTTLGHKEWGLADYSAAKNTWQGADATSPTKWDVVANWSGGHVPLTTDDVLIPAGKAHYPILTLSVEMKTLEISSGATLSANTYNITINGYNNAWQNNGIFDPGTGILYLTHGNINEMVTVSGSGTNQFHNIVIAANTFVRPETGFYMKINGYVSAQLSSIVDLSSYNTTVEYNGNDQTIVNPSHFGYVGYYNFVNSGTGTSTLYDGTLTLLGNFTTNGALSLANSTVSFIGTSTQTISGTAPVFNNLTINNTSGVSSSVDMTVNGILSLESDNPTSLDKGTLAMASTKILNMGVDASTSGIGDVSGIIKRTHAFATTTFYSFGNTNQGITFPASSGPGTLTSLAYKVTIGTPPSWGGTPANASNRTYEIAQTNSGSLTTKAIVRLNYKDNELANGVNESLLAIWNRVEGSPAVITDQGWSNYDVTDNYISISEVELATATGTASDYQFAIAPTFTDVKTWNGNLSTAWNEPLNWTPNGAPTTSYGVIIPDAFTTVNQPTLPASGATPQATCKYIIIENAGILNSGATDGATFTITDGIVGDAWSMETGGIFNPGNSTVIFFTTGSDVASISGSTNFYNLSVANASKLRPAANSYIGIGGVLTMTGTGVLSAVTNENTIEFTSNSAQNIPNPNGTVPGYHNLVLSGSGTKTLPVTLNIFDEFTNNTSATNKVDATTNSSTVIFNGNAYGQIISGTTLTNFSNLTLNNTDGLSLNGVDARIDGTLTFTAGKITTNTNKLILGNSSSVSGAGAGKYVFGNLQKGIAASTSSIIFEIGNATNYLPTIIDFAGTATNDAGYISCSNTDGKYPDYTSSGLNNSKYLNRYWTVTNSGVTFGTYDATFTFIATTDEVGSPTISSLLIKRYDGSWHASAMGTSSPTTVKTTGNTTFSDFIAGEALSSSTDYFRSVTTGDWSSSASWESSADGSTWNPATLSPTSSAYSITISNGNTITIDATATASNLYIESGATLTSEAGVALSVNGVWQNSGTFTAATGSLTFNGTTTISGSSSNSFNNLSITGTLTAPSTSVNVAGNWSNTGTFNSGSSTIVFNGSTAQSIGGVNIFNNLTVNNTAGVVAAGNQTVNGILDLQSVNPSATKGALYMGLLPDAEYILHMGASATTTGIGDVNGYINRTDFVIGTDYTFGNQYTLMNFTVGPLPSSVTLEVYLTTSDISWKTNAIHRYWDVTRSGGSPATRLRFNVHYLDAELNGATEGNLDLFDYHVAGGTAHDHGRTDYNTTNNWVGFENVGLVFLGLASSDDHFWTLGTNETSGESTWIGGSPSGQTDWDFPGNWEGGVPTTTSIVAIPSGRAYYPVLPTGKTIGALDIKDGGILNATTGSPTLTIAGTTNAWMNQGTFNGGTSTVVFTGNGAEIDGTTNFYNITINSGANIINHTNSVTRIGGVITKTGTWDASMADNFVEYNGESQTLVLPDFSPNYHNLILSGSGTKTMPASALSLYGEFIMMGTTSATAGGAMTIEGIHPNITIGTGCTFDASTFTHTLAGSWTNDGTFTASTSTIKFNGTAAENIGGTSASTFNNLDIDNTGSGLTLGIGQTINGTLSLTHGKLFLSDYNLTLNTDNAIAGTPNGSNYIEYTGTGKLVKNISAIMGTAYLFPVGTAGSYSPATFRLTGGTVSAASLSLSLANSKQTNITDANYINRYWTFTPTGFTSPVYNATFTYVDGDIIGTESTIKAYKYSGGWEKFSITNIGSNLLSFTGATAFSDYTGFGDLAVSVSSSVNPVCSGLPVTISASASGGNNGYSYTWDPSGSGASFSPSPDLTTTTAFYVTVTDGDGATQRASVNVIVDQRQSVMLNFNYNNLANTLLTSGITAELWQGGSQKATVSTPAVGHDYYEFTNTCPGTYDVMVSSATSTAGTINGTDAAQVNYWGTHTYTIEKVRFYAGDVAGNNKFLNSNDAQRINNNFVNGTALDRSGWTFWNASTTYSRNSNQNEVYADFPSLTLAVGSNKTENMYGVISGDFNLSYSPAKSLTGGNLELIYENNVLLAPNQEINLPIHIVNENKVGAISLVLNFPANLVDIQDVMISSTDGQLDWAVKNNELRIAWYSLNPLVLNAGDLLLNLRIKTTAAFSNGSPVQFSLAPNPSNELADELYNVINNAVISMASINATTIGIQEKPQVSDNLSLRNHPNPFVGTTTFTYDLPFDGKVSLEIYDFMGKRIRLVLNEQQLKGSHVLKLDASSLAAGIYMASLTLSSDNNKITRTIKLINNK